MKQVVYTYEQTLKTSIDYFQGDELAAKVFVDKYALRDNNGALLEDSPEKMHRRLSKEFARIEQRKFKKPLSEQEIFDLLDRFKYIVPQGSPMFGVGNDFQTISLSNCFLLDLPLDSYSSILKIDEQLVSISKRRGGVGIDLSNLRPAGSPTHNAARQSTGIVTWMERYSNSIREVGQGGRRGALMLTLSVHHPDILAFCTIKNDPTKVTGANISVRLTRKFLEAVKANKEYELCFPVDYKEKGIQPQISKKVNAKEIWNIIIQNAWLRAEPGLLMWDNITENTPADCYKEYASKSTNPCCFSHDSNVWVITKCGHKRLQDVKESDKVWTGHEFRKSSAYFLAGTFPVFTVVLSNNQKFEVTGNHKFQSNGKMVELQNLLIGDTIDINSLDPYTNKERFNFLNIISILPSGIKEVGCIEVDGEHKFVANGIISGNSEINLSPLDSCRLLCLNLLSYVIKPFTKEAIFDFNLFKIHSKLAQRLMDDLVDLESEKIDKILTKIGGDPEPDYIKRDEIAMWQKVKRFNDEGRRTGTGITALGDTIAALNLCYGCKESITLTEKIYQTLKLGCYESSVDMAQELGSFKAYDAKAEEQCPFIKRIKEEDAELYKRMIKYGRRNISLTTTAPTGSVSLLTRTTSGIEPLFMASYTRRKKINPNDKNVKIDFVDQNGDNWQEFVVYHPTVTKWMQITGQNDIKKSPWYGCCAEDIDWIARVQLQAAAQKHVCHSISSTINLPESVSKEKVSEIYQTAFESGLKGITVYRKNCRSGVLVEAKNVNTENQIVKTKAPKRPSKLSGDLHHFVIAGHRYFAAVGLFASDPYEIFGGSNHDSEGDPIIPKNISKGFIIKHMRGKYGFIAENNEYAISGIRADANIDALTRMISTALRHGADISFVVHQLEKTKGELQSFAKVLARILKKYIKDGTAVYGEKCPECKRDDCKIIREDGCVKCVTCGWTKCG